MTLNIYLIFWVCGLVTLISNERMFVVGSFIELPHPVSKNTATRKGLSHEAYDFPYGVVKNGTDTLPWIEVNDNSARKKIKENKKNVDEEIIENEENRKARKMENIENDATIQKHGFEFENNEFIDNDTGVEDGIEIAKNEEYDKKIRRKYQSRGLGLNNIEKFKKIPKRLTGYRKDFIEDLKRREENILTRKMARLQNVKGGSVKGFRKNALTNKEDENNILNKECGLSIDGLYFDENGDRDVFVIDFCNNKSRDMKEMMNFYSEKRSKQDIDDCFSIFCGWHKENCRTQILMQFKYDRYLTKTIKNKFFDKNLQKCNCIYRTWNKHECSDLINIEDKIDEILNNRVENYIKRSKRGAFPLDYEEAKREQNRNDRRTIARPILRTKMGVDDSLLPNDDDSVIFPTDEQEHSERPIKTTSETSIIDSDPFDVKLYTTDERNCFMKSKVWYNGNCWDLNTKSPCTGQEWLVLEILDETTNTNGLLKAVCKRKKCSNSDEIWWASARRCLKKNDTQNRLCKGKNTIAKDGVFGNGVCSCIDGSYGRLENSEDCFRFYEKGPCGIGQVVTYNFQTESAICATDRCSDLNNKLYFTWKIAKTPRKTEIKNNYSLEDGVEKIVKGKDINNDENNKQIMEAMKQEKNSKRTNHISKRMIKDFQKEIKNNIGESNKSYIESNEKENKQNNKRYSEIQVQTNTQQNKINKQIKKHNLYKRQVENQQYAPMNGNGTCYKLGSEDGCFGRGIEARFAYDEVLKVPTCVNRYLTENRPGCMMDVNENCREELNIKSNWKDRLAEIRKQLMDQRRKQ